MKISNEAKVGILAVVAIVVLVLGFSFLKGQQIFGKAPTLYAVFKNLGSLEKSNQVKINGLPIGAVYSYAPVDKEVDSIRVEIRLSRDVLIPSNSVAFIDGSPLGASYITIKKGDSRQFLNDGDRISTNASGGILADLKSQVAPTMTKVNETLDSLKLMIASVNNIFDARTIGNIHGTVANLAATTAQLQILLNAQTGALAQSLRNMNSVTENLARNNESINHSIKNIETTTTNLSKAPIKEMIGTLNEVMVSLHESVDTLKSTINTIRSPNGTLGALINDRKLYDKLDQAALSLEILLDDVRVHPKRYVNISVFGGKNKGDALTSPTLKDSIPKKQK